jgi:hypothetical protein
MTGLWQRDGVLEFVDYAIEHPEDGFEFIAKTQQGLLAYVLSDSLDKNLDLVADHAGFRFVELYRAMNRAGESLESIVAAIDVADGGQRRSAKT